jgi:predicted small lipoprotein YifL
VAPRGKWFLSPVLLIALAAAVGLAACGRKGALEAPPYAAVKADEAAAKPDTGPQKPNKPFVLDPLL